jgi:para-nitrobenzyl esterase
VAQNAAPVYVYLFTWETAVLDGRLKSCHALEIPFVFETVEKAQRFVGGSPASLALSRTMRRCWAAFARSGNPNHDGLPVWPSYSTERRPTMIFDERCRVEEDPLAAERRAWS